MTDYFYTHSLTVPAGRAIANPLVQPKILQDAILDRMQMRIPQGHIGLTGVAVWWSGIQLWPTTPGTWAIGDNELIEWAYGREVTQAGLQLAGYNLDKLAHTFYAKFWLSNKPAPRSVIISSPQAAAITPPAVAGTVAQLAGTLTPADLAAAAQLTLPALPDLQLAAP